MDTNAGGGLSLPHQALAGEEDSCYYLEFLWSVKEFSFQTSCDVVHSLRFGGSKMGPYTWMLRLYFSRDGHIGVHLHQMEVIPKALRNRKVRCQLSIVDRNGTLGHRSSTPIKPFNWSRSGAVHAWDQFIPYASLTTRGSPWLDNDTLRLLCSIWVFGDGIGDPSHSSSSQSLEKDLGRLLDDGHLADFNIVTNTKTFKVHKAILSARSKVFAAMFATSMEEAKTGILEIKDFDEDTMKGMLEYVYSGQVVNLRGQALPLLKIADKYDLPGLKAVAEDSIIKSLNVDNAADALVLAHLINAIVLKTKAIQFINQNKDRVTKTDAFQRLAKSDPALLMELYCASD